MPGQLPPSSGKRWYQEVDEQWQPFFQRRPPAVSEQLHDIIREAEREATTPAAMTYSVPRPSLLPKTILDDSEVKAHLKDARRRAKHDTSFMARTQRKSALAAAAESHAEWSKAEAEHRDAEHQRLSAVVEGAFQAWRTGNPTAVMLVANAMLTAVGGGAAVVSVLEEQAAVVVFAPALEEVHPSKPTWSTNGAKTIKSRSKAERMDAHLALVGAATVNALNAIKHAMPGVEAIQVLVVAVPSPSDDIGDALVLSAFRHAGDPLPTSPAEFSKFAKARALAKSQPLRLLLPDAFMGSEGVPAVVSTVDSVSDLQDPTFWLELSAALDALASSVQSSPLPSPTSCEPGTSSRVPKVRQQENELRELHQAATSAVDAADGVAVTEVFRSLLRALPDVVAGADDEAADVAQATLYSVAALRRRDLLVEFQEALSGCDAIVQSRLRPIEDELRSLTGVADKVIAHVDQHPGCLQAGVGVALGLEQTDVRVVSWYLAHYGFILRTKKGSSYLLHRINEV